MNKPMQTLNITFVEGWQAGYDGSRYESNPYQACRKEKQVWWSGWIEGAAEQVAETRRKTRFAAVIRAQHKSAAAHAFQVKNATPTLYRQLVESEAAVARSQALLGKLNARKPPRFL